MKNSTKILFIIFTLVLMSCGNSTKQTGTDDSSDTYYSRDPQVNENIAGDDNMDTISSTMDGTVQNDPVQDRNLTQEAYDKQRNAQMYSDLKMTDEQIQKYENASRTSMDTWKRDHPNTAITIQERMKIQNDNLKPILDESQYQNYGKWSTSNPYRN